MSTFDSYGFVRVSGVYSVYIAAHRPGGGVVSLVGERNTKEVNKQQRSTMYCMRGAYLTVSLTCSTCCRS